MGRKKAESPHSRLSCPIHHPSFPRTGYNNLSVALASHFYQTSQIEQLAALQIRQWILFVFKPDAEKKRGSIRHLKECVVLREDIVGREG